MHDSQNTINNNEDNVFNNDCFHSSIKQFLVDICELAVIYNYKLDIYGSIHVLADGLEISNLLLSEHLRKENKHSADDLVSTRTRTDDMDNRASEYGADIVKQSHVPEIESSTIDGIKQINSFSKLVYRKNACDHKNRREQLKMDKNMITESASKGEITSCDYDEENTLIVNGRHATKETDSCNKELLLSNAEELNSTTSLNNFYQLAANNTSPDVLGNIIKSYFLKMNTFVKDETNPNIYSCLICNAQLDSIESYEIHMNFHSLLIKSEDVIENFTNSSNVANINSTSESNIFNNVEKSTDNESYNETLQIKENDYYLDGNEIKSYEKLFKRLNCNTCNLSFRTMDGLKCHVNSKHSLRKTYKCQFCPKIFLTRQASYSHRVKLHSSSLIAKNIKSI